MSRTFLLFRVRSVDLMHVGLRGTTSWHIEGEPEVLAYLEKNVICDDKERVFHDTGKKILYTADERILNRCDLGTMDILKMIESQGYTLESTSMTTATKNECDNLYTEYLFAKKD
mmetsp:Transcript_10376/g.19704  ORF Transcript_10376/g.19704 Transcript_10376/m.19704 type:complete len:115 (+) Transcript_10376:48-392(+)